MPVHLRNGSAARERDSSSILTIQRRVGAGYVGARLLMLVLSFIAKEKRARLH